MTVTSQAHINVYCEGETPLFHSVSKGNLEIIKFLCSVEEIDVNKGNESGCTPLSQAVKMGREDIIEFLCMIDNVDISHKDWESTERRKEMFNSPILQPLVVRMAMMGCYEFDVSQRNRLGDTLAHMAVKSNLADGIKFICEQEDVDFNVKNQKNETAFDLIFPENGDLTNQDYLSILRIACRTHGKDVVTRRDSEGRNVLHLAVLDNNVEAFNKLNEINKADVDVNAMENKGDTTLSLAIQNEMDDLTLIILSEPQLKAETHNNLEKDEFHILKDVVVRRKNTENDEFDSILKTYLSDTTVPDYSPKNTPFTLKKLFESADDKKSVLDDFRSKIDNETCPDDVKRIYIALRNITLIGLQQYANHKDLQYVLYKGSVIKTFVKIFVELRGEKYNDSVYLTQLLRVLYISTQANIKCDCESPQDRNLDDSKTTSDIENKNVLSRSLAETLGEDLHKKFKEQVKDISCVNINTEVSNAQLIAKGIQNAYFKDETGLGNPFEKSLTKASEKLSEFLNLRKFFHKCVRRGDFAFIVCFMSIFIQSSDILSDAMVGFKTFNGFSKRLGIFMIALVFVTLIHENIRSVISAYETDQDLLRITLGRKDITDEDIIEKSELNYYNQCSNQVIRSFKRFFWTFKVCDKSGNFSLKSIKPLFFNVLSILMLRPVVDRLIVLSHSPSHLRAVYRQQSKQKSLNQYYMILEQMPELLIQFYVFQIYFNNLRTTEDYKNYGCTELHSFTYRTEYFECVENLWKLKICAPWWEIYSMLVPFFKIPDSMVSLEKMFRILSPETPKMSAAASVCLYVAYILMIPSRLFLFAAVMHSVASNLYVIAYLGLVTLVWLFINVHAKIGRKEGPVEKKAKEYKGDEKIPVRYYIRIIWSLLLFTVRDMVVISLRSADAYLMPPSEVHYSTIRTWRKMLVISSYYFVEAVVGAVVVEHYYPCGQNSEIMKYQGWLYLITLIISVTIITLLSYILQPTKMYIIPRQFPIRAAVVCLCGLLMWAAAALIFQSTTKNSTTAVRLPLIITTSIISLFLLAVVVILRFFSEAKLKKRKEGDSTSGTPNDKKPNFRRFLCCNRKFSCLCCCSAAGETAEYGPVGQEDDEIGKTGASVDRKSKEKSCCVPRLSSCFCCSSHRNPTRDEPSYATVVDQQEYVGMSQLPLSSDKDTVTREEQVRESNNKKEVFVEIQADPETTDVDNV